ncbi:MAG: DUF962 domain-containing protein [Myxococcota bacterium]|nr:DUF962 domain-containing protein [Myxococcota bacterium]
MSEEKRIQTFAEFWPFYLGEHRSPLNRALHYLGTSAALSIVLYAALSGRPLLGLLALLAGYGPAWIGHFFIEKNRPASFSYPAWSFRGDLKMVGYFLTGRMGREITRLYGSRHPAEDAPLLTTSDDKRAA